jgi:tetratricopeptide (TPR) repeat protein
MEDNKNMSKKASRPGKRGIIPGLLLLAGLFILYLFTLCPSVYWWDSGEFITDAYTSGVAHPTGFPLYMLLAKLILLGTSGAKAALRMNFLSAFFSILCSGVLYCLLLRHGFNDKKEIAAPGWTLSTSSILAVVSGLFLAASGLTWWSQSVITEVYTLNLLFLGATLFLLMEWYAGTEERKPYWFLLLCFSLGLGLAIHTEMLLIIPPILLGMILKKKYQGRQTLITILYGTGFVLIGLLLYLYIPIRGSTPAAISWGHPSTFLPLKGFLTQSEFGNKIFGRSQPAIWFFIRKAFDYLIRDYSLAGILLGLAGIIWLGWKNRIFAAFTGLIALGNLFLAVAYGHPERMEPEYSSFLLPLYLVWGLLMTAGIYWILSSISLIGNKVSDSRQLLWLRRVLQNIAVLLLIGIILQSGIRNGNVINGMKTDSPHKFGKALLSQLPPHSIVLVRSVYTDFILLYLQQVEGERKDITLLSANRKEGFPANPEAWLQSLPEGSPVYCEYELISSLKWENIFIPAGYWGKIEKNPPADEQLAAAANDEAAWEHMMMSIQAPAEPISPIIIRAWHPLALARSNRSVLLARKGMWKEAFRDSETASLLEPDYSEPYLLRGIWYLQGNNIQAAQKELEHNTRLNPLSFDGWSNLGVAYAQQQQWQKAESAFLKAVALRPSSLQAGMNLARLYQATGQSEKAQKLINKFTQNLPASMP